MKVLSRFSRQVKIGYFASVHLDIELNLATIIEKGLDKHNSNPSQGNIIDAPSSNIDLDDWIEGAELGIKYGLIKTDNNYRVVIEKVEGLLTDTNPLIVSVAAIIGIWDFLKYIPSENEIKKIEQWAFESWTTYKDKYPQELIDMK